MARHYLPFSRELFDRINYLAWHEPQYRRYAQFPDGPAKYLDFFFTMDPKTPILASREGTVLSNLENYSLAKDIGADIRALHQTNLVRIVHSDQTVGVYTHVFPRVREGQSVAVGEKLGELGGWALDGKPHLHLDFFQDEKLEVVADVSFLEMPLW